MPYETEMKWTLDEALKLNRMHLMKMAKGFKTYTIVVEVIFFIIGLSFLIKGNYQVFIFALIMLFVFPLIAILVPGYKAKRNYMSNKVIHNCVMKFKFYEDKFSVEYPDGNSELAYDKLYKVIETEDRFYLYISSSQAYAIIKDNCCKELIDLLKSKC